MHIDRSNILYFSIDTRTHLVDISPQRELERHHNECICNAAHDV